MFQIRPRPPPGRRTRAISATARSASNQWKACATVREVEHRDALAEAEVGGQVGHGLRGMAGPSARS
ncbi:MAG TPA: hypothetical protein VFW14_20645 [Gaiellales bacterium]|nr:hypothetical protein [Gaiellales bacterium]